MDNACGYAASNCNVQPPDGLLPMTGFELLFFIGLAVTLIALGLSLRYSR
jgi:hypothetical protein